MAWEIRESLLVWPNAITGLIEDYIKIVAPRRAIFSSLTQAQVDEVNVDVLVSAHKLTAGQPAPIGRYISIATAKTAIGHA